MLISIKMEGEGGGGLENLFIIFYFFRFKKNYFLFLFSPFPFLVNLPLTFHLHFSIFFFSSASHIVSSPRDLKENTQSRCLKLSCLCCAIVSDCTNFLGVELTRICQRWGLASMDTKVNRDIASLHK